MKFGSLDVSSLKIGGIQVDKMMFGTSEVWANKAPAGSQTFTAGGTFTVPNGYTEVTLCIAAGGGSGQCAVMGSCPPSLGYIGASGGGAKGEIYSGLITGLTSGEQITITIGSGGASVTGDSSGNDGTSSIFGSYKTVAGGLAGGFAGAGGSQTFCGGTFNNGDVSTGECNVNSGYYLYGGEAGAFGHGGEFAGTRDGGIGAGGCGVADIAAGIVSGAGGDGKCVISWS